MPTLLLIIISSVFVNNFVLSRFLGICPFLGVSKRIDTALGMGLAVTFVMTIASAFAYMVYAWILVPLKVEYLYNIAFILVIASLVQMVEMVIQKVSPTLYSALGVYLPLITTNCAVLGVALNSVQYGYNILQSVVYGLGISIGFTIAIVILAGIREKMEYNDIPESWQGMPIVMVTAGLMSIAFFGFSGII